MVWKTQKRRELGLSVVTTSLQSVVDPLVTKYQEQFSIQGPKLPGAAHDWVASLREDALSVLSRNGLPTRRVESWKYTDLRNLYRAKFTNKQSVDVSDNLAPFILKNTHTIVFVDGNFVPTLSGIDGFPKGLEVFSLADALESGDEDLLTGLGEAVDIEQPGFTAVNTALMEGGGVCRIEENVSVDEPIHFIFVTTDNASAEFHLRNLVVAGAHSKATVMQSFVSLGESSSFCNVVTELVLREGANLRNILYQAQSKMAWHIGLTGARLERDAHLDSFVLSSGARLARNEIRLRLDGEGAECSINGIALVRGRQHCDNTTDVEHTKSCCHSSQIYKNVLDDHAHTVFQGRVHVAPNAQKTDAQQMNRNLLLSRNAQADSKPELIIHADDVKCSHGATVGDLDQEALFYLQSRGINPEDARNMMVHAFAAELVEVMPEGDIRYYLEQAIMSWLETLDSIERAA